MTERPDVHYPILDRPVATAIAHRDGVEINCTTLLADVLACTDALPDQLYAINLCADRYLFTVAFLAALLRGKCNLLIPTRPAAALSEALASYPDACILHDGSGTLADDGPAGVRRFQVVSGAAGGVAPAKIPAVPGEQLAAIVFTSGSTGVSQPIYKSWRSLWLGVQINRRQLFGDSAAAHHLVATVPPWHMYGLEWSVLMSLASNTAIYSGDTFYPDDIRAALRQLPAGRCLVTTPLHLRALVRSGLDYPITDNILSATATLDPELAGEAERQFAGTLLEIYGCSEAGSMASRYPTVDPAWAFFDEFDIDRSGDAVFLAADHVDGIVRLADTLEFDRAGRFQLIGRDQDLVKIGGKRASLVELTNRLLTIDGVEDGVIFSPDADASRLSALVASKRLTADEIRRQFARLVDPVFLPRPLHVVDRLPRSDTGKMRRQDLLDALGAESGGGSR